MSRNAGESVRAGVRDRVSVASFEIDLGVNVDDTFAVVMIGVAALELAVLIDAVLEGELCVRGRYGDVFPVVEALMIISGTSGGTVSAFEVSMLRLASCA